MRLTIAGVVLATVAAYGAQWAPAVQRIADAAPVRSPAEALASFSLPANYRVELVVSEPLVQDPILIDWDISGRLWVVELPGYMRDITSPGELDPVGRIVVLEDTNADGAMDKRTVFTDQLVQPRALMVLERGVLVGEPPNIWLLKDTDGDLHVDGKELIATGYGRAETNVEVNANGLHWALDNRIYVAGTGADMYLRFKDAKFEVHRSLSRGQWGITSDDAGRIFRNHNESVLHVDLVPTPYYTRNPNLLRTRGSHEPLTDPNGNINAVWPARQTPGTNRAYQHGVLRDDGTLASFTAACAPTVYRGDRLPSELQGNVFVAEPAANLVSRIVVFDDGTGLRAKKAYERAEFLTSTDERFRPVHLSNAPDGTLYIVDMYRGIIQHRTYITEYLRDQIASRRLEQPTGLGRIYRVMHESTVRDSSRVPPETSWLVGQLSHPNGWRRDAAQRTLIERGATTITPTLSHMARQDSTGRLHALWTLDALDAIEPAQVLAALKENPRALRVAAIRIAERWLGDAKHPVTAAVVKMTGDGDRQVRHQLSASIGALPAPLRESSAVALLQRHANDPVVMDATLSSLRGSEKVVLETLLADASPPTSSRETAVAMLAATLVRGAQDAEVQAVFARLGNDSTPRWQRSALLRGAEIALTGAPMPGTAPARGAAPAATATAPPCPTCPGGRAGPGGAYAFPRPADWPAASTPASSGRGGGPRLRLNREPLALTKLAGATADEFSARAVSVLTRVEWPGKPGAAAADPPLTAEAQRRFNAGQEIYRNICQACHQPDGRGQDRLAPSLIGSTFALAAPDVPIRILLHGKEGTVGLMPPIGATLNDEQIADVLTYIRREWGHTGAPVDAATVRTIRATTAGRTRPWTDVELRR